MRRENRLKIALGMNLVIVVVQVIAGVLANSIGLIADAGHNLSDVAAVVISLIAVRLARRPATSRRSFGWHRSTILAAQANAAMLLVVTGLIVVESLRRLTDPAPVESGVVILVAGIAMLVNAGSALILVERGGSHDLNMRSALLHMISDALASAGVLVAGIVMTVADGLYWLDPLASLLISVMIGVSAVRLLGETADVLLESTPSGMDTDELIGAINDVDGVESVHDLHVWSLSSDVHALAAHLVVEGHPSLEEAQVVGDRVKHALADGFSIAHATLELECEACAGESDPCLEPAARSAAAGHAHRH